ncbi:peptidoglycan DD-metalloendopeptidase family protein [Vibrio coralliilyticus]|uniref:peptidoglycan DD-metalloendopeptidase family protein n=1 Tax=Vibrio coralliilyticus TaxID=190893 RepID=UPI000BAB1F10|nr:peptidoglycan DD-metalloendopeptidase family protein [Vibrio coralliilyticus]NOI58630.1 peptidoglycan DD-metalloendopeptidase family protein [Vibrio coralliilyticus]PAT68908.1 peptidase M23 [Vibrio coralliilyticus]
MLSKRSLLALIAVTCFSIAAFIQVETTKETPSPEVKIPIVPYQSLPDAVTPKFQPMKVHYIVKVGDTLSSIFSAWHLPYQTLQHILEADLVSLKLDTIKPGDHLEFVIDNETRKLNALIFHESLVEQAIYEKDDSGQFSYRFDEQPGSWRSKLYSGEVNGSFSVAAHRLGLSTTQIANITRVLRDKVNFARDLRAGDSFNILIKEQYLDDHKTGNAEIEGISLSMRSHEIAAFLADDGRFYDREGNSLEQAFDRYPITKAYRRITSPFNPKRRHPVTGRISPHNGTDFATPVGTPIYSTGDGKVIAVRNHPYAGKYLVIEHNSVYKTRYLHLSRFLVKKGQHVKRGQKIALSGATGRLTGPHLHFEVLVRNRAVDPMKANLPLATSIPKSMSAAFTDRVANFDASVAARQKSPEKNS